MLFCKHFAKRSEISNRHSACKLNKREKRYLKKLSSESVGGRVNEYENKSRWLLLQLGALCKLLRIFLRNKGVSSQ